jgi:hypothetical protein
MGGIGFMHDTLTTRILRRLETLPEAQLYQVLDYIEFLDSRYSRTTTDPATGIQWLAERLEDGLRKRTMSPAILREAFQVMAATDRVLRSVSEVGLEILQDLHPPPRPPRTEEAGPGRPDSGPSMERVSDGGGGVESRG